MDASLDEDFVNFETFSQTCASTILTSGTEGEEIRILDNEASQRDSRKAEGEKNNEEDDEDEEEEEDETLPEGHREREMKPPSQNGGESTGLSPEYHLFTTFSYNSTSKKLTMIPVKYKIKEERRKVLKISVNKLKKIDDPESWLCRSVLINNTMKKLQKETREEKINKQLNGMSYSKSYVAKTTENDEFGCPISNNNNNNNNNQNNKNSSSNNNNNNNNNNTDVREKVYRVNGNDENDCFYQKELGGEGFYKLANGKSEEFLFQVDKAIENEVKPGETSQSGEEDSEEDKLCISGGVSLNEDFVEKIPSIKRCASRKKSVDEDGTADEILNLNDSELVLNCEDPKGGDLEDVDECDVHDVLSQLYMPPTPRMLASMEGDGEDELNVVDIDSSYIDGIKAECPKLPSEGFFESGLLEGSQSSQNGGVKRDRDEVEEAGAAASAAEAETAGKRRKLDDVFSCFNVCEERYDNFLCSNRNSENERTSDECRESEKEEEQLIELEDEEDIKRRLSQSLSSQYHRKSEKSCENFFEESCDNQYSCGHTVTMFSDMQSVTFHNLIASLET